MRRFLLLLYSALQTLLLISACNQTSRLDTDATSLFPIISNVTPEIIPTKEITNLPLSSFEESLLNNSSAKLAIQLLNTYIPSNNILFSPLGIQYVTGILANIVQEPEYEDSLISAIYSPEADLRQINDINRILLSNLAALDLKCHISTANLFLVDKQYQLETDFFSNIELNYQACAAKVDMHSNSTIYEINNWVKLHTNGNITTVVEKIISDILISNSIYFSAPWSIPFSKKLVDVFSNDDNTIQYQIEFVSKIDRILYKESDSFQSVVLPFGMGKYRMIILLPKGKSRPTASDLDFNAFEMYEVETSIPIATIFSTLDYSVIFHDLFGIDVRLIKAPYNTQPSIYSIEQRNLITWNETGAEASSLSSISFSEEVTADIPKPLPKATFKADHPFYFFITTADTSVILYAGYFNNVN